MRYPVIVLVLLAVLVIPVHGAIVPTGGNIDIAQSIRQDQISSFSYTANADEKISIIEFDIPIGTQVNFTLYYGTGANVCGLAYYRSQGLIGTSYSEVSIEDRVYEETFLDAQAAGISFIKHVQFTSYARNSSVNPPDAGFAIYAQGYGLYSSEIAYYPITNLQNNLIYRVDVEVVQGDPINLVVDTARAELLEQYVSSTVFEAAAGGIIAGALELVNTYEDIKGIFFNLFYWFKFIFWDNIVLTFALYVSGTMAYSAMTSRSIFDFYRKFFRLQKTMLDFMIGSFNAMIQMVTAAVSIFKP